MCIWMVEPKIGGLKTPKMDGLFIMENPMNKWDDLGVPLFLETPIYQVGYLENIGLFCPFFSGNWIAGLMGFKLMDNQHQRQYFW